MKTLLLSVALALASSPPAAAQSRVILGGVPTNLTLDLSNSWVVPCFGGPDVFLALIPLASVMDFVAVDSDFYMDVVFGTGQWLRCTMWATDWAYLSDQECAHTPAVGTAAPLSLLTTSFDYGYYFGVAGAPHVPWPNSTLFAGNPACVVSGLSNTMTIEQERWQLRTRGFFPTDLWNDCGPSPGITPVFDGWLVARFVFAFS